MRTRTFRKYRLLTLAAGTLFALGGCGLSDYQLATVWQSVLTTGLSALVTGVLTSAFPSSTGTTT